MQGEAGTRAEQGMRSVVIGMGVTGLSVARFLTRRGDHVVVMDTRMGPPEQMRLQQELPQVTMITGGIDEAVLVTADRIVVSPGLSLQHPQLQVAQRQGIPLLGDIELFAQHAQAPIAAITGSNGKSTVTTLLGEMAKAAGRKVAVGGNLGVPALDLLDHADVELYILELSSFQLETTTALSAAAATVLNISPDHLDRYSSLAEYAQAKAKIFDLEANASPGVMVLNEDDPKVRAMARPGRKILWFGLGPPLDEHHFGVRWRAGEEHLACGEQLLLPVNAVPMPGRHNIANALAALAMGHALGFTWEPMLAALRHFTGLPHRTQWIAEHDGVIYYDDSKGTNVGATMAAIEGLARPLVLIAGGDGKGQDFTVLRDCVKDKVKAVVLLGRDAPRLAQALQGVCDIFHAQDMYDAVALAKAAAKPGDAVLLSPACASLDMFRDYHHRGEVYRTAVLELTS
jgi:UDP-N-acetylmuramoylalanine--D-glutamate ligase